MTAKNHRRSWDQRGLDALSGIVEKRRHQRIDTSIAGHILLGVSRLDINVVNLSRSGALLNWNNTLDVDLNVGDTLELSLIWPLQASNCALQVEASIVRLDSDALAVKFAHLVDEAGIKH